MRREAAPPPGGAQTEAVRGPLARISDGAREKVIRVIGHFENQQAHAKHDKHAS